MRARAFALALVFPFWGLGAGCNQTPLDVATIAPTNLANGLVAHWTFDETAGATAHDSSGNGRDGSVFGPGWSWTTGHFSGALQLSGDDQVTVGGGFGFPAATANYTVAAWLYVASTCTVTPAAVPCPSRTPWSLPDPENV